MTTPPYGIIWDALKTGDVIPFLGAGASFGSQGFQVGDWNPEKHVTLPTGSQLAHFLADRAEFPSSDEHDRDDLAKVASFYSDSGGRPRLRSSLHEVFDREYEIGPVHKFLAELEKPLLIVVTNYDTLVEEAFQEAGKPYDLVMYPSDRTDVAGSVLWWRHNEPEPAVAEPKTLQIDLSKTTVIFKMHGSIFHGKSDEDKEKDSFVITEDDYIEFLSRMTSRMAIPSQFYEHCLKRSFLFLGYSLRDWNLRVVLRNLRKLYDKSNIKTKEENIIPSWAIQYKPTELEKSFWGKRGVNIYDQSIDEFISNMNDRRGK